MLNNKTNSNLKGLSIFVIVILVSLVAISYDEFFKSLPQNYAIGTVDKIWKPVKGGTVASYIYSINGKEYNGNVSNSGFEEVAKPGKRFIVEYPEANISRGVMHLDIPVPDSIIAPEEGWDELPKFAR